MAKKIKKTTKATKTSRLAHEVKHTDWKFVTILVVLAIIAFGVFNIYRGLAATNPETYWNFFNQQQYNKDHGIGNKNRNGGSPWDQGWNATLNSRAAENRANGATTGAPTRGRGECTEAGTSYNAASGACQKDYGPNN